MNLKKGNIVVLTGAGISAESGLETFRGAGGLWEKYRIEDVATPEAFQNNPELVQRFYNERRKQLLGEKIQPNAGHKALARLEHEWNDEVLIVTQNIDDLHERAGSKNVLHMHGMLFEVRCINTGKVFTWKNDVEPQTLCECCEKTKTLRPHVVWFGEMPLEMDRISASLGNCALFLSVGTSGNVYPAAGFVQEARMTASAHTVELNLETSAVSHFFHEQHHGRASKIVPSYVERLLQGKG